MRAALLIGVLAASASLTGAAPALGQGVAISIHEDVPLSFGKVVAGPASGSVTVDTSGVRTVAGGAATAGGLAVAAAALTVTGEPGYSFSIVLPGSTVISDGAHEMTVDAFESTPQGSGHLSSDAGPGSATVRVGATLRVGAGQARGSYLGAYTLTVAYE